MYEKEFSFIGKILDVGFFQELCVHSYSDYLEDVIEFKCTEKDLKVILDKYKDVIFKRISENGRIRDIILTDELNQVRHDKDILKEVNLSRVTKNVFKSLFRKRDKLNVFEEKARHIILLEAVRLINCYGMETLLKNKDMVATEVELGIFESKTNKYMPSEEKEKVSKRIELVKDFGKDAIEYIENYELLKSRTVKLREFTNVPSEVSRIEEIIKNFSLIDSMLNNKDKKVVELFKRTYEAYEQLNREMIVSRLNSKDLNEESDALVIVHFIPNYSNDMDINQQKYFRWALEDKIEGHFIEKYGRKYNPNTDKEEARKIYEQYKMSQKNPFDLSLRVPLKNRYMNSAFKNVITPTHTNLSTSISKVGSLRPHLDRKIAMIFEEVPIDAIKTISRGYNNELDKFSFEKHSFSLPEVLEYICERGTNETLIDWTKVKPTAIMIYKDTEELDNALLEQARIYSSQTGLPIKIYDAYAMERKRVL